MTQGAPARPLRADARRNRETIVAAADELFRTDGMALQMDAVAHRAGLGVGTLYRHFPTKEALLIELVVHRFETALLEAEEALVEADSAVAIRRFVDRIVRIMVDDAGLQAALSAGDPNECAFYREELMQRKLSLISRAQTDGNLRTDVTLDDFGALICALGAAIQAGGSPRLVIDVMLDGLHVPRSGQPGTS